MLPLSVLWLRMKDLPSNEAHHWCKPLAYRPIPVKKDRNLLRSKKKNKDLVETNKFNGGQESKYGRVTSITSVTCFSVSILLVASIGDGGGGHG